MIESMKAMGAWLVTPPGGNAALWVIGVALALGVLTEWLKMVRLLVKDQASKRIHRQHAAEWKATYEEHKPAEDQPGSLFKS